MSLLQHLLHTMHARAKTVPLFFALTLSTLVFYYYHYYH